MLSYNLLYSLCLFSGLWMKSSLWILIEVSTLCDFSWCLVRCGFGQKVPCIHSPIGFLYSELSDALYGSNSSRKFSYVQNIFILFSSLCKFSAVLRELTLDQRCSQNLNRFFSLLCVLCYINSWLHPEWLPSFIIFIGFLPKCVLWCTVSFDFT